MNGCSKEQNGKNENVKAFFFLLNKSILNPQKCLKPLTVQLCLPQVICSSRQHETTYSFDAASQCTLLILY